MVQKSIIKRESLLVYTRLPEEEAYSTSLAGSVHFAYSRDGVFYEPLNQNYGILFPSATIRQPNTLNEKALRNPFIFHTKEGEFGILAVRINADGSEDDESRGKILIWTSEDLIRFDEKGLFDLGIDTIVASAVCRYDAALRQYIISWQDKAGRYYQNTLINLNSPDKISAARSGDAFSYAAEVSGPEGAVNGNILDVDASFGEDLLLRWSPLENIAVHVPKTAIVSSKEELNAVTATAVYTDGSTAPKQVRWESGDIDFKTPGIYSVSGTVFQPEYPFPLAKGYADPDILHWNGKYYFLATNDNMNFIGLYVREADTVEGLFNGAPEHLILDKDEKKRVFTNLLGAGISYNRRRAIHSICRQRRKMGTAVSYDEAEKGWKNHRCRLLGNACSCSANGRKKSCRRDRGYYTGYEPFSCGRKRLSHLVLSHLDRKTARFRFHDLHCRDKPGSTLKLISEPVLLTRPVYGWENIHHTINNEGPYAFVANGTVYLTYSGGAAGGYSYAVGLLTAKADADLLDPSAWNKRCTPVMSYYSAEEFGPGHNAFFVDESGNLMITFHAEESYIKDDGLRCSGMRRVHFDIHGNPRFDMTPKRDLNPQLCQVTLRVVVK